MTKWIFARWPFLMPSSSEQLSFLNVNLTGFGYFDGESTSLPMMTSRLVNPFEPGDALAFGNEGHGLPADFYTRYEDRLFRIPMPGRHARSINLANAVSIAAYECYRQLT